jgi:ATP phosphoribosyltransferase regulatory subunit
VSSTLLSVFESYGYEQVSPPLLEYSENLLAGRGATLSSQIFRVMDPSAHKVMGLRGDITLQIARIATSRLATAPRPLRLCYNGLIMRMQGEQVKADRQLRQTGIELIGTASPEADAEVIVVAAEALKHAGVKELSIDLNLPGIVSSLLASEKLDNTEAEMLFAAIAHKDISTIKQMRFGYRDTLISMLQCAGPARQALDCMERLDLPESARRQVVDLQEVVRILGQACPQATLTIDATENRGFSYHSGISFSMFVPGAACEVGRGGRYLIEGNGRTPDTEATGFTLYVETLRSLLPELTAPKKVFVADGIGTNVAQLHGTDYVTVHALSEYGRSEDEAKRLGCSHIFTDGQLKPL